MPVAKLLEPDIKALVLNHLLNNGLIDFGNSLISEFTIGKYSRRVDLAVTNENSLTAFEIKSEADSLSRLEGQVDKYLEYFDKVTVVAASKHIETVLKTTPDKVGVWEISAGKLAVKRKGKIDYIKDKSSLLELMRANELRKLSNMRGLSTQSLHRDELEIALRSVSVSALRRAVFKALSDRFASSYSTFWNSVDNQQINPLHIDLLSPYKAYRQALRDQDQYRENFWKEFIGYSAEDSDMKSLAKERKDPIFGDVPCGIKDLIAT